MRARIAFGLCLTAASLLGCGQGSLSAPKPAPEADVENRAMPQKQPRALPPLIAPPPKYGNKIVMAQASGSAPTIARLLHLQRDARPGRAAAVVVRDGPDAR